MLHSYMIVIDLFHLFGTFDDLIFNMKACVINSKKDGQAHKIFNTIICVEKAFLVIKR